MQSDGHVLCGAAARELQMSRKQGHPHSKEKALRSLLVSKMGIEPGMLRRASPQVAGQYDSQWAPVEELASRLERLPAGTLQFLANHPNGYLVVSSRSRYEPDDVVVGERSRTNVAFFDIGDLNSPFTCIRVAANLVDHLLGCDGKPDGLWLSDGGGITPALAEVGEQISRRFDLGYAITQEAGRSRHDYLAHSLAWYIEDRRKLNVADPQIERLLKRSLMDEAFWNRIVTRSSVS